MSYTGPDRRRRRNSFARALLQLGHDPGVDSRWHHIWRDFVPLVALVIAAYAVFGLEDKVDKTAVDVQVARRVADSQREGRQTAVAITCGAISAVIEAGRATITSGSQVSPEFERNLRKLGYPPRSQREEAARKAARAYSVSIAQAVEEESGVQGIVREDGTLNCERVQEAARAAP